jgi:Cu-Zn family superoxide dismutase
MKSVWLGLVGLIALMSPAFAQDAPTHTASFIDVNGKDVGKATLTQTPAGVLIDLEVRGLAPGVHAFHVHEKGLCDAAGKFVSAGGHYNVGGKQHGFLMTGGPHAGDMPNQFVGSDGILRAQIVNPNVTLGAGNGPLLGPDGTALVIHAKQDDYRSQPAGDAGDRVACAVLKR